MFAIFSYGLLFAAIGFGFWRGGGPERSVASILAAMFLLDRAGHLLLADRNAATFDHLHLTIDAAGFASLVAVSLKARRYWPLWASSCQLISVFTHIGWTLETKLPQAVYLVVDIVPSLLISFALFQGTWMHRRRLTRRKIDQSWKDS